MFKKLRKVYYPNNKSGMVINFNEKEKSLIRKALKRIPRLYETVVKENKVTLTFRR